jgi:hypothetical protein
MRFVSPETVRITLKDGFWIEVKKELTVGEQVKLDNAGMGRWTPGAAGRSIEIDYAAMTMARVEIYLVDWNAKGPDGKDVKLSRSALEQLDTDSFVEIDEAIQAHIRAMVEEKKARAGASSSVAASA